MTPKTTTHDKPATKPATGGAGAGKPAGPGPKRHSKAPRRGSKKGG